MIPETERAYLAGILDGEGAIMLYERPKTQGWTLRVYVANTDIRMLEWLAERFDGTVRETWRSQAQRRPNERTTYGWQRDGRSAIPVLEAALPYLLIKRRHAEVALAFASTCSNTGRPGHNASVARQRSDLVVEMRGLNRRGRP